MVFVTRTVFCGRGGRVALGRRRSSPVAVFVCIAVFLVVYVFLLRNVLLTDDDEVSAGEDDYSSFPGRTLIHGRLLRGFYLSSDQWRLRGPRIVRGTSESRVRHLMAHGRRTNAGEEETNELNDAISCRTMSEIDDREFIAGGWTKAVYGGRLFGRPVAVKVVNTNGHDVQGCIANEASSFQECYRKSAAKILKEIVLLKELAHDNMLKVFGYCIPNGDFSGDDGGVVAMVTELGEPMDIIKLLQMSWEDRLRICVGVSEIIYHLAHSPLGSLAMNDFRRQQFVLVDGEVKLSDVDDVSLEDPPCPVDGGPCLVQTPSVNVTVPCVGGSCPGFNEKLNTAKAGRHFVSFLLPHGAPSPLRPIVDGIVRAYNGVQWDSKRMLDEAKKLVRLYVSGEYLREERQQRVLPANDYVEIGTSDFPGKFDYRCQLSLSANGCTLSVFDTREAKDICSKDPDCKAFVLTDQTTWTGRKIVHLKSNFTQPSWNPKTTLYLKED